MTLYEFLGRPEAFDTRHVNASDWLAWYEHRNGSRDVNHHTPTTRACSVCSDQHSEDVCLIGLVLLIRLEQQWRERKRSDH